MYVYLVPINYDPIFSDRVLTSERLFQIKSRCFRRNLIKGDTV